MSILSKWISRSRPYAERELEEKYTQMISLLPTGMTFDQIRQKVKQTIRLCKEAAIREGTTDLPDDYGGFLILGAQAGDLEARKIVDKARSEGATNEDIREFWSLNDLERRMVKYYENAFLSAMARSLWKPGLPEHLEQEMEVKVRKTFPVYGDPNNGNLMSSRDQPLPYELRARVERWRTKVICERGEEELIRKANRYSSFNALVRAEIQKGSL
jgi:hypothetical protein